MASALRFALASSLIVAACSSGDEFTVSPAGSSGAAGSGTGGTNAAGSTSTGGSAQAGTSSVGGTSSTAGTTSAGGSGATGGSGAAGQGTGGTGTAGSGTAGSGTAGKGGTGTGGTGTAGTGTAGTGTAGTGTAGTGTGGAGTGGSGTAGAGGSVTKPKLKDACAMVTGAVFDPVGKHCYVDITSTQSVNAWNESGAAKACSSDLVQMFPQFQPFATHLLEVEQPLEQAFVTTSVVTSSDRDIWIHLECKSPPCACGNTCGNHQWQWADDSPPQYWDPSPDMMPWGPTGPAGLGNCAAMTPALAGGWEWSERGCDAYQYSGPTGVTRYYEVVCEIE